MTQTSVVSCYNTSSFDSTSARRRLRRLPRLPSDLQFNYNTTYESPAWALIGKYQQRPDTIKVCVTVNTAEWGKRSNARPLSNPMLSRLFFFFLFCCVVCFGLGIGNVWQFDQAHCCVSLRMIQLGMRHLCIRIVDLISASTLKSSHTTHDARRTIT